MYQQHCCCFLVLFFKKGVKIKNFSTVVVVNTVLIRNKYYAADNHTKNQKENETLKKSPIVISPFFDIITNNYRQALVTANSVETQ